MNSVPFTSEIDWDFVLSTIQDEKCILFLGPEIFTDEEGHRLEDKLFTSLDLENNQDIQKYYKEDNLFLFNSRARKTKLFYKIKNFYQQDFPEARAIFEKIAQIPFHFIVQVTPDKLISKTFKELNVNHMFQFYWKKTPPDPRLKTPTSRLPLIYNMLGSIDRQESMVLTHNDLFDYFESIFSGNSMPERLKKIIKEADNFIFLGISFDKWYMQLLLRILYIHNDFNFVRYASNQAVDDEVKTFCFEQFKIEFVPNKIREFVDEFHARCVNANLIRQIEEEKQSPISSLIDGVAEDRIKEVLGEFRFFLEELGERGQELIDDVILLTNKFNRLNKRILQDIIDHQEANLQSNKIRKELLALLHEAQDL